MPNRGIQKIKDLEHDEDLPTGNSYRERAICAYHCCILAQADWNLFLSETAPLSVWLDPVFTESSA
jgi:hypothetical protein